MPIKRDIEDYVNPYGQALLEKEGSIYDPCSSLPDAPAITGNVSVSNDSEFGVQSLYLNQGAIRLGTAIPFNPGRYWRYSAWVKFETNAPMSLLLLDSLNFIEIGYKPLSSKAYLTYGISTSFSHTLEKTLNITNGWHFLVITREGSEISIEIDYIATVKFSDVFVKPSDIVIHIGKSNSPFISLSTFKIQSALFKVSDEPLSDFERNVNLHRQYYKPAVDTYALAQSMYLSLTWEYNKSQIISPISSSFSFYSHKDKAWIISPSPVAVESLDNLKGLRIRKDGQYMFTKGEHCIDLIFKLDGNNEDLVLYSGPFQRIRLTFNSTSKKLYFRPNDLSFPDIELTTLPLQSNTYYRVVVVLKQGNIETYLNGDKCLDVSTALQATYLHFEFNTNTALITNNESKLYVRKFVVRKITGDYKPLSEPIHGVEASDAPLYIEPFNLHQIDSSYSAPSAKILCTVPEEVNIIPGTTIIVPVNQSFNPGDVEYKVEKGLPFSTNLVTADIITINNFTYPSGQLTYNLSVTLSLFDKFKLGSYFYIYISNAFNSYVVKVNVINVPDANLALLKGNGYIEGVLSKNNWIGTEGSSFTGTGLTVNPSIYGPVYRINNHTTALISSVVHQNVRTIFLLYQEIDNAINRLYVGGPTYTFNGGPNGEVVGDLITASNTLLLTNRSSARYKQVVMSANGQRIVRVNETAQKVELLNKAQTWDVLPVNLNLGLQSPSTVDSASVNINSAATFTCLGFPNANNAEGVVQVWNLSGNLAVKELHLGSPSPQNTIGGFGFCTEISENGQTLYVSELGTNKLYIYRKSGTWSATPIYTLTYSYSVIEISCYQDYLLVTTSNKSVKLYQESTPNVWTEVAGYTGVSAKFDKLGQSYYVYSDITNTVKLYSLNIPATSYRSISTNGYIQVAICNGKMLIARVDNSAIDYYDDYNNTFPVTLSDTRTDYGIRISLSQDSAVVSDYATVCDIYTSDSSAYGERLSKVYLNGVPVNPSTILDKGNMQVLCFTTAIPMSIDKIGSGYNSSYGAGSLNGILMGMFLYENVLTDTQIAEYTSKIKSLTAIQESALIE